MLERRDVDHALLGPGGFFAVETKYRSDWSAADGELAAIAAVATQTAHGLRVRLGKNSVKVRAIVVMWGPGVQQQFPDAFERDGVTFCPGHRLRSFAMAQSESVDADDTAAAFAALDRYVRRRDQGEVLTHGPVPRQIDEVVNDFVAVGAATVLAAIVTVAPARWHPAGVWCIAVAAVLVVLSRLSRRRFPAHVRLQRVTTAIITTSAGIALLMVVGALIDAA
jgi:hypothetical protein